jgi:hypothetical protein
VPQNEWIDRCAMELGRLCDPRRVQPWQLADLAAELWSSQGNLAPEDVARAEFDEWPPYDD